MELKIVKRLVAHEILIDGMECVQMLSDEVVEDERKQ